MRGGPGLFSGGPGTGGGGGLLVEPAAGGLASPASGWPRLPGQHSSAPAPTGATDTSRRVAARQCCCIGLQVGTFNAGRIRKPSLFSRNGALSLAV